MKPHVKIPLYFLAASVVWIVVTDQLGLLIAEDIHQLTIFQTFKGWIYVFLATLLVYFLTRSVFRMEQKVEEEKMKIFEKTLDGAHHILLNYLNQMQLITVEAEGCHEFDRGVLREGKKITEEAKFELENLRQLQHLCPSQIDDYVYRKLRAQAMEKEFDKAG